jgi:hypothetical protein
LTIKITERWNSENEKKGAWRDTAPSIGFNHGDEHMHLTSMNGSQANRKDMRWAALKPDK